MSVKITGTDELLAELERRLGKARIQAITDEALIAGAEVFAKELKYQISSAGDKGYAKGLTVKDTIISAPFSEKGVRTIKIHWNGPHGRYRIIHLNEWGTVKIPRPPRKGRIAVAMRNAEKAYRDTIKQILARDI